MIQALVIMRVSMWPCETVTGEEGWRKSSGEEMKGPRNQLFREVLDSDVKVTEIDYGREKAFEEWSWVFWK